MEVVFTKQFKYSPNGYDIITCEPGPEPIDLPPDFARTAIEDGYGHEPEAKQPKKGRK